MNHKLSIVIPAYNEAYTISKILDKIKGTKLLKETTKEIIVIDDFSTDSTYKNLLQYQSSNPDLNLRIFKQLKNMGKGAAIRSGIEQASGDFLIIQDADLEYDPAEYNLLLKPILEDKADVVYGSRFMGGSPHRILFFWHSIGNKFLTLLSNAFNNLNLTDMETCYKMFRIDVIKGLQLQENRFGFEPEVTAKISRIPQIRIYEVGISYYGRSYAEGKKINWKDGMRALYCIFKYGL